MEHIPTVLVAFPRQMRLLEAHVVICNKTQVISGEISSVLIATRMIATNAISLRKISYLDKKISIMIVDLDLMIIVQFARAQLLLHFSIHAFEIQVTASLQTTVVFQGQGMDVFQKLTMMIQSGHVTLFKDTILESLHVLTVEMVTTVMNALAFMMRYRFRDFYVHLVQDLSPHVPHF
jgi:hypothetical protein